MKYEKLFEKYDSYLGGTDLTTDGGLPLRVLVSIFIAFPDLN